MIALFKNNWKRVAVVLAVVAFTFLMLRLTGAVVLFVTGLGIGGFAGWSLAWAFNRNSNPKD
jgi:hypothetical protein